MQISKRAIDFIFLGLAAILIILGTTQRINIALKANYGKDHSAHLNAINDLFLGRNPYTQTIKSYSDLENDPGNKGYAYLPGIMYTNSSLYIVSILKPTLGMPFLMQLPGILANIGIGFFFIKTLFRKNKLAMLFAVGLWMFNPYFYIKGALAGYDAVTICLVLWALYFLRKDDVISGALFALSVIFKTYPVILGLVFLLGAKNKKNIVLSGLIIFILFSLPFLGNLESFQTYLQGSIFVHGDRFIQGRPYLYYLSYLWDIQLIQIIPFSVYSMLSIISGWIITLVLFFYKKIKDKYILAIFPYLSFYLFAPVLNRTYLLWGIPVFLMGTHKLFEKKYKPIFYILNVGYWIFAYWYLIQWKDGFHIHARL